MVWDRPLLAPSGKGGGARWQQQQQQQQLQVNFIAPTNVVVVVVVVVVFPLNDSAALPSKTKSHDTRVQVAAAAAE